MDQLPILTARTFVGPAVEVCKVLRRGASRCRGEAVMCRPHALRSGPAPDLGKPHSLSLYFLLWYGASLRQ